MKKIRSVAAAIAGLAMLAVPSFAGGWTPTAPLPTDVVVGTASAPVTVYEYISFTCPHCARFHRESAPVFIRDYVDTGKARLVIRHFPLDRSALGAALAVACMPEDIKLRAAGVFFDDIEEWAPNLQIATVVAKLVEGDMSALEGVADCMAVDGVAEAIMSLASEAMDNGVDGTPAFVIGGKVHVGFRTPEELGRLVEEASRNH